MTHYHIRWSSKTGSNLDWERFTTAEQAKESAEQLMRPGEKYNVEQFDGDCPKCAEMKVPSGHSA